MDTKMISPPNKINSEGETVGQSGHLIETLLGLGALPLDYFCHSECQAFCFGIWNTKERSIVIGETSKKHYIRSWHLLAAGVGLSTELGSGRAGLKFSPNMIFPG